MPTLRFYDFFAGVGLVELALAPAWECVWANDIDPKKKKIYDDNFPDPSRFVLGNVEDITANDLPTPADMAWASFPCQDLSLAGWRRGINAQRSGVFWSFHRIMRELQERGQRPPIVVIENVVGLLYGQNFAGLCEALAVLGLQFGVLVIDASHFVPQSRPRVFVVAVDVRVDVSRFVANPQGVGGWFPRSVWNAWEALSPDLRARWRWWRLPMRFEPAQDVAALIEPEPTGVRWNSDAETGRLLDLMSPTNLEKVEQARRLPGSVIGFLYKRTRKDGQRAEIRFDGIAGCLRTTYGGSSRQTVVLVQDGKVRSRLLSPREAARLMGVHDGFRLPDQYNLAYRAMGDAVAVPAVAWLGKHLLTPMAEACRESTGRPAGFAMNGHGNVERSLVMDNVLASSGGARR